MARRVSISVSGPRRDGRGLVFDASTGFNLPNGATRSPDVAWVWRERIAALSEAERRGFLPLAPDLVIELASPTDDVPDLLAKMHASLGVGRGCCGPAAGFHSV